MFSFKAFKYWLILAPVLCVFNSSTATAAEGQRYNTGKRGRLSVARETRIENRRQWIEKHCLQNLDDPKCAKFLKQHFSSDALLEQDCASSDAGTRCLGKRNNRSSTSADDPEKELRSFCSKNRSAPRCAALATIPPPGTRYQTWHK